MTTTPGCTRSVGSWSDARDYGKPIKDEGLCARHLAGKKRSDAASAKAEAAVSKSHELLAHSQAIVKSLAVYGIISTPEYSSIEHGWTGKVVVDGEAVLKALKDMGATR